MALERLQKILARAGISSRRHAEQLIVAGRVRVNGRVITELGVRADSYKDKIEVDGNVTVPESPVYVLLHKPRAVVSTASDPEGRSTVTDLVTGLGVRLYPVGRLDFQTSGALLMTNDGEFAAGMLHPSKKVPKKYLAKLEGALTEADVKRWRDGVVLDDGHKTLPADAKVVRVEDGKTWLEIVLREGRNQQIRRMGQATGHEVIRLTRLSFAGISIEGLRAGGWRLLTADELRKLRDEFGVPRRVRPAITQQAELPDRGPSRAKQAHRGGLPNTHARVRDKSTAGTIAAERKDNPRAARERDQRGKPRSPGAEAGRGKPSTPRTDAPRGKPPVPRGKRPPPQGRSRKP
ncbi:MAG: pseudouridine synthase [Deltaproteobacteria bacterium]|nr:pseudouridine synthase [Deltaproteobacteria bacterium]